MMNEQEKLKKHEEIRCEKGDGAVKKIVCSICKKQISYRDALHNRAHKMTSRRHFMTEPEEYLDVCENCWERIFKRGVIHKSGSH